MRRGHKDLNVVVINVVHDLYASHFVHLEYYFKNEYYTYPGLESLEILFGHQVRLCNHWNDVYARG